MSFIKSTAKGLADVIPGLGRFTFDDNVGTTFITSGTGVVGYRVALSMLEAGHKDVRVGVWKGDRQVTNEDKNFGQLCADVLEAKGAQIVDFDWTREEEFEMVLQGVKTIFCTIPHMEGWADVFPSFLRAAKRKKVEHFIKISFMRKGQAGEAYRTNVPFVSFHGTCDDILMQAKNDSRISFTILSTSHVMSTPLLHQGKLLREQHKFVTASYGMGVNYVSPNDICDAAMVVMNDLKKHRNRVYNLTGPGPIKDSEVAKLLTEFYGHEIEHVQLGYHEYKKDVRERGLPNWLIRDSAALEKMKASGIDEDPASYSTDLEKLVGRKGESFRGYLTNKACMRPGAKFP